VVVDQGGQQQPVRMVEVELGATVRGADDVLVALQDHLRRGPPAAGRRERRRNGPDKPAGVDAARPQHMGRQGRAGGLAEGPGHDGVGPPLRRLAHQLGEGGDPDALRPRRHGLDIVVPAQLGAGALDQEVEPGGQVGGIKPPGDRDAQPLHEGRHGREDVLVGARDRVAGVLHHLGDGGHARPGDSGEVDLHGPIPAPDVFNGQLTIPGQPAPVFFEDIPPSPSPCARLRPGVLFPALESPSRGGVVPPERQARQTGRTAHGQGRSRLQDPPGAAGRVPARSGDLQELQRKHVLQRVRPGAEGRGLVPDRQPAERALRRNDGLPLPARRTGGLHVRTADHRGEHGDERRRPEGRGGRALQAPAGDLRRQGPAPRAPPRDGRSQARLPGEPLRPLHGGARLRGRLAHVRRRDRARGRDPDRDRPREVLRQGALRTALRRQGPLHAGRRGLRDQRPWPEGQVLGTPPLAGHRLVPLVPDEFRPRLRDDAVGDRRREGRRPAGRHGLPRRDLRPHQGMPDRERLGRARLPDPAARRGEDRGREDLFRDRPGHVADSPPQPPDDPRRGRTADPDHRGHDRVPVRRPGGLRPVGIPGPDHRRPAQRQGRRLLRPEDDGPACAGGRRGL